MGRAPRRLLWQTTRMPPYRWSRPPEEPPPSPTPPNLGSRRSTHPRTGLLATALASAFTVDVHESGLAITSEKRSRHEVPFSEIDELYFDFEFLTKAPPTVTVVTFDEARIVIPNDLADHPALLSALDRGVTRAICRDAVVGLGRGERLLVSDRCWSSSMVFASAREGSRGAILRRSSPSATNRLLRQGAARPFQLGPRSRNPPPTRAPRCAEKRTTVVNRGLPL